MNHEKTVDRKNGLFLYDNGVLRVKRKFRQINEPYAKVDIPDFLSQVDHNLDLDKDEYEDALSREEEGFNKLVRQMTAAHKYLLIVLQGRDGAGKSGLATRLWEATGYDPKLLMWIPIGAPTDEELSRPYFHRFLSAERAPKVGQVRIFDRSWHERLLVEPVMKLTPRDLIDESYAQIRTFEWLQESLGAVIVKIWMDITKGEQKKRFEDREKDKPWKVSPSDAIARRHWNDYTVVANEMFYRTGSDYAPWNIISSESKRYSRVAALQIINFSLKAAL